MGALGELPEPAWYALGAKRQARAWREGARGEESVGDELTKIARRWGWRYIHSVPVGSRGSDIDHVLVGPGGVYTINTKAHRGSNIWVGQHTFLVNGQKQPYLRNSRHEARRAAKLLSAAAGFDVHVHPLIVVVDPRDIAWRNPPTDVTVVTRRGLSRWASRLAPVLDEGQIEQVFSIARRSTTWFK